MIDVGKQLQDAFDEGYKQRDYEIVRCKDCKYSREYSDKQLDCIWFDNLVFPNGFCSDGKRRSE